MIQNIHLIKITFKIYSISYFYEYWMLIFGILIWIILVFLIYVILK